MGPWRPLKPALTLLWTVEDVKIRILGSLVGEHRTVQETSRNYSTFLVILYKNFCQLWSEDTYTIACTVTAQNLSDSILGSLLQPGKGMHKSLKIQLHNSHTSCNSVDMVYPTEKICLTVDQGEISKSEKMYNQLHKLTDQMYKEEQTSR